MRGHVGECARGGGESRYLLGSGAFCVCPPSTLCMRPCISSPSPPPPPPGPMPTERIWKTLPGQDSMTGTASTVHAAVRYAVCTLILCGLRYGTRGPFLCVRQPGLRPARVHRVHSVGLRVNPITQPGLRPAGLHMGRCGCGNLPSPPPPPPPPLSVPFSPLVEVPIDYAAEALLFEPGFRDSLLKVWFG